MSVGVDNCVCELLSSGVIGAAAFPSLLAVSQTFILKPFKISCSPRLSASIFGLASVTVASLGATLASLQAFSIVQKFTSSNLKLSLGTGDVLLSTVSGVVMYRALGGRYASALPSNLMRPGAFAVEWIPALNESVSATVKEREVIQMLGGRHGCHSCGERGGAPFIADHQPPSKVLGKHRHGSVQPLTITNPSPTLQRFYPHCMRCSSVQGGILSGKGGSWANHPKAILTHVKRLRPYHLFMPFPFVFAYLKAMGGNQAPPTVPTASQDAPELEVSHEVSHDQVVLKTSPLLDDVLANFPLVIIWRLVVQFLTSFSDPMTAFHMTLWGFTIIASLGTI